MANTGDSFDIDAALEKNLGKVVVAINDSEAESAKGATALARLLTAADKRANKEAAVKEKTELEAAADRERAAQALEKLSGLALATAKFRDKAEKFKQVAAGKVHDWGAAQLAKVKDFSKSMLSMLMKGLGLAALWGIFKLIEGTDWEGLLGKVGFWIDSIFTAITRIGAWLGVDRLILFLTGKSPLTSFVTKVKSLFAKETFLGRIITSIKNFFNGKGGALSKQLNKFTKSIKSLFSGDTFIGRMITKIKSFFGGKGGGGKLIEKIGKFFTSVGGIFGKIPGLAKITNFIKGAGKFLGKIFLPVTVLMGLWEAVTGFMSGFENTKGNLGQKIIGGIGGAIQGLIDFFIVDLLKVLQDVIVWLGEFFGFDMSAIIEFDLAGKIGEWLKAPINFITDMFKWVAGDVSGEDNMFTNLIDFISGVWSSVTSWFTGLLTWASEGIASGWTSLTGYVSEIWTDIKTWFTGLFSWGQTEDGGWSLTTLITTTIDKVKGWVTGLFSWAASENEEDSFVVKTVKNVITGVKEWFGKMFKFDSASDILASAFNVLTFFPNLIKDALLSVTEWLLGLFGFGDEAKKVANAKNFSIGDMIVTLLDKLVTWLSELFNFDIKAIIAESLGALGDAGKKVMGWLGFGGDDVEKKATGGPVGKGAPILVGEHGPELFVPSGSGRILPKAQTATALGGGGGGAPIIMNAPTTNVRGGSSTTMAVASSSINPMHNKYFRN